MMQTPRKPFFRIFFAIHCYMWAVVAIVGIINAMRSAPVDSNSIALWAVVLVVGIAIGSLLIRRPRL